MIKSLIYQPNPGKLIITLTQESSIGLNQVFGKRVLGREIFYFQENLGEKLVADLDVN